MAKKKTDDSIAVDTVDLIRKTYGAAITRTLDELTPSIEIPTGSITLDYILGGGIFPGLTEIFGAESAGKSSLALSIWKNAHKKGIGAYYIDQERSLTQKMLYAISGLDPEEFVKTLYLPGHGEEAIGIIETICRSSKNSLVILDSVPACLPLEAMQEIGKDMYAAIARMMSKSLPALIQLAETNGIAILFLNQMRATMNTYGGPQESTSGGKAIKYYANRRIELKRGSLLKRGQDKVIGHEIKIKTLKNRYAAPYQTAEVPLIYGKGVDAIWDIKSLGLQLGVLKKAGAWITYKDKSYHGDSGLTDALEADVELFNELTQTVKDML